MFSAATLCIFAAVMRSIPTVQTEVIVGVDEAGRGPLAGPVVAGACFLPCRMFRRRRSYGAWSPNERKKDDEPVIADSKALSEAEREAAYAWITTHCSWGVGTASAADIDTFGILAATEMAMQAAIRMLAERVTPTYLLVDGNDAFWFDYPRSSVVRGDGIEPCIAAASIIAKVTRDRWICEAAKEFPQYGFERHKGYGAPEHRDAILRHGPCVLHRQSFLRNIMQQAGASPAATAQHLQESPATSSAARA